MSLSQNRFFQRFWLGQTASNLGDAFGFVAMPLLVFEATHSVVKMGYVTGLTAAGQLLGATFSGVVVDRVNRRALMVVCDLARLVLYAALPVLAALGALHMSAIYAVALLTAVASNLFLVAYMAAVANLVEPHEVGRANGRLQATQASTYVIGAALAGALCSRFGAAWAMGIDAVSFGASAFMLTQIRFRNDRAMRDAADVAGPLAEIASGLRYLASHATLRALTLFQAAVALLGSIGISAAVIDLVIYRLKVDLRESATVVGEALALASVGAVAGALASGRVGRRVGYGRVAVVGTALQGCGLMLGGLADGLLPVILCGVLWSGGLTFRAVGVSSMRQTLTPDALMGRILAAGWVLIFAGSALGAMLVTRAGAHFGVAAAMASVGVCLLVVAAAGAFSPLRG